MEPFARLAVPLALVLDRHGRAQRHAFDLLRVLPPDRVTVVAPGAAEDVRARVGRSGLEPRFAVAGGPPADALLLEGPPDLGALRAARVLPERDAALAALVPAFAGIRAPAERLRPGFRDDLDVAPFDAYESWEVVPDDLAEHHWAALPALAPGALAAFAPAFMRWTLRFPDSPSMTAEILMQELPRAPFGPPQTAAADRWRAALSPWLPPG